MPSPRPRQFDSALRWMVPSSSGQPDHLVELDAYNGNGKCACQHFQFRLEPELVRGAAPGPDFRCGHIKAAREEFLDMTIALVIDQRARQPQPQNR